MEPLLSGSVGENGKNNPEDVTLVQTLLNAVPVGQGGPQKQLKVDGKCGDKTISAIQGFQLKHFGWHLADGRLDQNGPTWQLLSSIISQLAPILLQAGKPPGPRRNLNVWLKNLSGKPAFDFQQRTIVSDDLRNLFSQILPHTKQFNSSPSVSWSPSAAQIGPQDLLVYFVDLPKYGVLPDATTDISAGGLTGFINTSGGDRLVMQVYCIEQSQDTLRPGYVLAKLAFHEIMHGRLDVGPNPKGRDPKTGKLITDLHTQGGMGLAEYPTPPHANLTPRNRDLMAHNLHLGVELYTGRL